MRLSRQRFKQIIKGLAVNINAISIEYMKNKIRLFEEWIIYF